MKIKKVLASILSLVVVSSVMPMSISQNDTVMAISFNETYSSWQEAYTTILQDDDFFSQTYNAGYEDTSTTEYPGVSSMHFNLIYLDNDDIPELAVYFQGSHYSGPSILKYNPDNGIVNFIFKSDEPTIHDSEYGEFGTLYYMEKNGILFDDEAGMGSQYIDIFEVDNFIALLKESYYIQGYTADSLNDIFCYNSYVDGGIDYTKKTEISKEEVISNIEKYNLVYDNMDINGYLEFSGYTTLDLTTDDTLNTQENRDKIINYTESNPTTTTSSTSDTQSASNKCGDNATWSLSNDGTLTISGTGAMYDYDNLYGGDTDTAPLSPWFSDISKIKKIIIEDGITYISSGFVGCTNLTELTIPNSVTSIADIAFRGCTSLMSVTIPKTVTSIGTDAFGFIGEEGIIEGFTIYGYSNTSAEEYVNKVNNYNWETNKIIFVPLNDTQSVTTTPAVTTLPNSSEITSNSTSTSTSLQNVSKDSSPSTGEKPLSILALLTILSGVSVYKLTRKNK